jgi:hypothetical protein
MAENLLGENQVDTTLPQRSLASTQQMERGRLGGILFGDFLDLTLLAGALGGEVLGVGQDDLPNQGIRQPGLLIDSCRLSIVRTNSLLRTLGGILALHIQRHPSPPLQVQIALLPNGLGG